MKYVIIAIIVVLGYLSYDTITDREDAVDECARTHGIWSFRDLKCVPTLEIK